MSPVDAFSRLLDIVIMRIVSARDASLRSLHNKSYLAELSAVNCVLSRSHASRRGDEEIKRKSRGYRKTRAREFIFIQSGINVERAGGRTAGRGIKSERAHARSISSTNSTARRALWTRYKLAHVIISISNSCRRAHKQIAQRSL